MVLFGVFGRILFGEGSDQGQKQNGAKPGRKKSKTDATNGALPSGRPRSPRRAKRGDSNLEVRVPKFDDQYIQRRNEIISFDQLHTDDFARLSEIEDICSAFFLGNQKLTELMEVLLQRMEEGLAKETASKAVIKMLPSYVRSIPNGTEHGNFLALDLGGTNFRVLLIRLEGKEANMSGKIFRVPHEIMIGSGQQLFDHIAECMSQFMGQEGLLGHNLPLGFTFSFPCEQFGLTEARLITWTKGFKASGVEGVDVVQLLKQAVDKRPDIEIDVVALLNDTTGTLMTCAHQENSCMIGVIVGTGTNACYMEKIRRCSKLQGEIDPDDGGPDEVIINTEWGAFGSGGGLDSIRTPFDHDVDSNSINPGKQIFEKMISGMYMGELVRLVLEKLCKDGLIFEGNGSEELYTRGTFPTKYVSEIESDLLEADRTFSNTFNILEDLGLESITPADCANVAYACTMVSTRAAHLCAAGIAVLINRMGKPFTTVGVDGSVYRFHPHFKTLLELKIQELVNPKLKFQLMLSEDGSGKGAALVAAVACRVKEETLAKKMASSSVK